MASRTMCILAAAVTVGMAAVAIAPALADDLGQCRVTCADGRKVTGEVTQTEEGYRIRAATGITVFLRTDEIRQIEPLGDTTAAPSATEETGLRRAMSDLEIEEILGSEDISFSIVIEPEIDLMAPIPTDDARLEEMKRIAGLQARWLETDHFLLVYTASTPKAKQLASRLEAIYEWRVKFLLRWEIEPVLPKSKLETFFFATQAEFQAYQTLHGNVSPGTLGFWHPVDNRSCFYDLETFPYIAPLVRKYKDPRVPYPIRRKGMNLIERWVEHMNMEVIQHEAGHHTDFNIGMFPQHGDVPRWLVEGLTMQFENPPSQLGASFGKINYNRLFEIRKQYGPNLENLFPLRPFMLHDMLWFQGYNYPLGWALVHYLHQEYPDKFAEFMRVAAQREDDYGVRVPLDEKMALLEDLFGEIDEEWDKAFKNYISSMPMRKSELVPDWSEFP